MIGVCIIILIYIYLFILKVNFVGSLAASIQKGGFCLILCLV